MYYSPDGEWCCFFLLVYWSVQAVVWCPLSDTRCRCSSYSFQFVTLNIYTKDRMTQFQWYTSLPVALFPLPRTAVAPPLRCLVLHLAFAFRTLEHFSISEVFPDILFPIVLFQGWTYFIWSVQSFKMDNYVFFFPSTAQMHHDTLLFSLAVLMPTPTTFLKPNCIVQNKMTSLTV